MANTETVRLVPCLQVPLCQVFDTTAEFGQAKGKKKFFCCTGQDRDYSYVLYVSSRCLIFFFFQKSSRYTLDPFFLSSTPRTGQMLSVKAATTVAFVSPNFSLLIDYLVGKFFWQNNTVAVLLLFGN